MLFREYVVIACDWLTYFCGNIDDKVIEAEIAVGLNECIRYVLTKQDRMIERNQYSSYYRTRIRYRATALRHGACGYGELEIEIGKIEIAIDLAHIDTKRSCYFVCTI